VLGAGVGDGVVDGAGVIGIGTGAGIAGTPGIGIGLGAGVGEGVEVLGAGVAGIGAGCAGAGVIGGEPVLAVGIEEPMSPPHAASISGIAKKKYRTFKGPPRVYSRKDPSFGVVIAHRRTLCLRDRRLFSYRARLTSRFRSACHR
jgi:hypothetical protein